MLDIVAGIPIICTCIAPAWLNSRFYTNAPGRTTVTCTHILTVCKVSNPICYGDIFLGGSIDVVLAVGIEYRRIDF